MGVESDCLIFDISAAASIAIIYADSYFFYEWKNAQSTGNVRAFDNWSKVAQPYNCTSEETIVFENAKAKSSPGPHSKSA